MLFVLSVTNVYTMFSAFCVLLDVEPPAARFHYMFCAFILPPLPHYLPSKLPSRVTLHFFVKKENFRFSQSSDGTFLYPYDKRMC